MFEMSSYNAKDKLQSTVKTTISEKESSGDKVVVTAHAVVFDPKSKELSKVDYDVTCQGGDFKIDMRAFASSMTGAQGMEGVEMHMEGDEMAFPKNLQPGMSLPDASFSMKMTMNGMTLSNTSMKSTNRKVTGTESITTPAGTFPCILIESDSEVKTMGMSFSSHDKSWYSLGVGLVRQESFKGDKMESYQVLSDFKK